MRHAQYEELPPAPSLRRHVLTYWRFTVELAEGESFRHHVWPDGCVSVSFSGPPSARRTSITGPALSAKVVVVDRPVEFTGIRFWPDVGAAIVGRPAEALRGRVLREDLFSVSPKVGRLDAALIERGVHQVPIDQRVRRVVEALFARGAGASSGELAALAGWTPRHLQRRFRECVGLTPKEFARIRRVRAVIAEILGGRAPWAEVAAAYGYADQAHLVREVAAITGFRPSEMEQRLREIQHSNVSP